jgi:hypothetical protein
MKLLKTSVNAASDTPSEEFAWTYIQLSPTIEYGQFYRNEAAAINAANNNYHNFPEGMKHYSVIIVKATTGWNV